MSALLKYLSNVHEIRVMEPLTLINGIKKLDFKAPSSKPLWIAYRNRLKTLAPSIDFTLLSQFILNVPSNNDRFTLLDTLVKNLINKPLNGQLEVQKSLIALLKHMKTIGYSNDQFFDFVAKTFDQLSLSSLNLHLFSDLCNSFDYFNEDFYNNLLNTFFYLLKSLNISNCSIRTLESVISTITALSKFSNTPNGDLIKVGNEVLNQIHRSPNVVLNLSLINSIIQKDSDLDFYSIYVKEGLSKVGCNVVSKDLINIVLDLAGKTGLDTEFRPVIDMISSCLQSNLIEFNEFDVYKPLDLCIKTGNRPLAEIIIQNLNVGKCDYDRALTLLDSLHRAKTIFNIDIPKAGYIIDNVNFKLTYKPPVPLTKLLKLGYVEPEPEFIPDKLIILLCQIASISSRFNESLASAEALVYTILNIIKSRKLLPRMSFIDMHNILDAMTRLKIRDGEIIASVYSLASSKNIDNEFKDMIINLFAELGYPKVEYTCILSRGRRYLQAKASDIMRNNSLNTRFLYGFATPGGVLYRINRPINRKLWERPFIWAYLFDKPVVKDNLCLDQLEKMITETGYSVIKRNVLWKGLFNIDILAKRPGEQKNQPKLIAINLLMPNDFYSDKSVCSKKRLQLHLLSLDIETLNVHYEDLIKHRENAEQFKNEDKTPD